jgi:hypothetical protein
MKGTHSFLKLSLEIISVTYQLLPTPQGRPSTEYLATDEINVARGTEVMSRNDSDLILEKRGFNHLEFLDYEPPTITRDSRLGVQLIGPCDADTETVIKDILKVVTIYAKRARFDLRQSYEFICHPEYKTLHSLFFSDAYPKSAHDRAYRTQLSLTGLEPTIPILCATATSPACHGQDKSGLTGRISVIFLPGRFCSIVICPLQIASKIQPSPCSRTPDLNNTLAETMLFHLLNTELEATIKSKDLGSRTRLQHLQDYLQASTIAQLGQLVWYVHRERLRCMADWKDLVYGLYGSTESDLHIFGVPSEQRVSSRT